MQQEEGESILINAGNGDEALSQYKATGCAEIHFVNSTIPLLDLEFCFFFSSRRRHTRFDCDWSSDVCSSDLEFHRCTPPAALVMASSGSSGAYTAATIGSVGLARVPDSTPVRGSQSRTRPSLQIGRAHV